jgi:8-oxo-dGTP diphosphatase
MSKVLSCDVFHAPPENFHPSVEVAGCFCEWEGRILLLLRALNKPQGNTWGIPAGKVEKGEPALAAALRELKEETGIPLLITRNIEDVGILYVRQSDVDFLFHLFRIVFIQEPNLELCKDEIAQSKWLYVDDALQMPLIAGGKDTLLFYKQFVKKRSRKRSSINVYLVIKQRDKILLALRKNTGYEDGNYSLVAGHVEPKESAIDAAIREAKEEIGIDIEVSDFELVHTMHRNTDRDNVDLFFLCKKWAGNLENIEPDKCVHIKFFEENELPENMAGYVKKAVQFIRQGVTYSEYGW